MVHYIAYFIITSYLPFTAFSLRKVTLKVQVVSASHDSFLMVFESYNISSQSFPFLETLIFWKAESKLLLLLVKPPSYYSSKPSTTTQAKS